MAKNILVISCDIHETRAALIENGIIAELHIERKGRQSSTVGNVYLGKVTRVLPGLQAAFVDIGQERAAFLHVEDLIRPDDFDEYLAGGRKLARGDAELIDIDEGDDDSELVAASSCSSVLEHESHEPAKGLAVQKVATAESALTEPEPTSSNTNLDSAAGPADWPVPSPPVITQASESGDEILTPESRNDSDEEHDALSTHFPEDVASEVLLDHVQPDAPLATVSAKALDDDEATETDDDDLLDSDDLDGFDMPGFTVSEPGEPIPRALSPALSRDRGDYRGDYRGGRRRRGRSRRDGDRPSGDARSSRASEHRGGRGGGRLAQSLPGRISKSTPIREVISEGQEIIVQVTKDPIGTKGARCSSHISLPGRYVVYLPTVDHIGISKRIGNDKERARLRETIEAMKPPSGGLIVRTVAEGLTKKDLKQDVGYLVRLWGEIAKKRDGKKAPQVLSSELDLVLKVARDLFTDEVHEVVIDDKQQYDRLCRFVEMFAPDRVKDVKLYDEEEPIFDEYGIEDEIGRALARKVPLPSGGYLIIDQAEALTAIDVNTGRFVGKGSKDMEETIVKTNLEAVSEIAYQLRFRNIGGLIILDLIDMESHKNREKVRRTLEDLLQNDKAKTTLNRISELGLIEMTRKRTRESLGRLMHEPCFYCDGTGQLQSKETIAYEILREIRRKRDNLPGYSVVVNAHPAVADVLNGEEKEAVTEAENRFMRKIFVVPRKEYHLEQFDLQGK
ncbi:MAG: Rne/Rng family ribonuclease [Polyangiaceae bacterium]|nr:Rne/Rng family ribonuclease [Polyangiaceae bacterium]